MAEKKNNRTTHSKSNENNGHSNRSEAAKKGWETRRKNATKR